MAKEPDQSVGGNVDEELARLVAEVEKAVNENPQLRRVQQEQKTAFVVAEAVRELLQLKGEPDLVNLARTAGLEAEELRRVRDATSKEPVALATLVAIADALDYRFDFRFLPRELAEAMTSDASMRSAHERVPVTAGQAPAYRVISSFR